MPCPVVLTATACRRLDPDGSGGASPRPTALEPTGMRARPTREGEPGPTTQEGARALPAPGGRPPKPCVQRVRGPSRDKMPTTRSASSERRRDGRGPSQPPRPNRRRDGSSPRVSVVSGCRWLQPLRTDTLRSETPRSSHRPSGWPHQVSAGAHRSRECVSRAQPRRRRGDPHGSERRPEQSRAEDPPRGRPPARSRLAVGVRS